MNKMSFCNRLQGLMPEKFSKQRGSAGVMALIAVMLLGSICLTFAGLTLTNLKMASEYQDAVAAQYAAEAAANFALASFSKTAQNPPDWSKVTSGNISGVTFKVKFTPTLTGNAIAQAGRTYAVTVTAKNKKAAKVIKFSVTASGEGLKPDVSKWQYY